MTIKLNDDTRVSVGADPELFIYNTAKKEYVSAWGLIPGTKYEPHKVECGAIQADGMAAEFNIDPAFTKGQFVKNITTVKKELQAYLPENCRFSYQSYADFGHLKGKLEKEAWILGCDPDFYPRSIYEDPCNKSKTPDGDNTTYRTSSGHIHIGFVPKDMQCDDIIRDKEFLSTCASLVWALDNVIGLPMFKAWPDNERKKMYGFWGSYRPKPYGLEYRAPTNNWVKTTKRMSAIYDSVKYCIDYFNNGGRANSYSVNSFHRMANGCDMEDLVYNNKHVRESPISHYIRDVILKNK